MNSILHLKGQLKYQKNQGGGGPPKLPIGTKVKVDHLKTLKKQLERVLRFWETELTINGALVSVYYKSVVAKSNRLRILLGEGDKNPSESIRGSRFYGENPLQHVFIHYIKLETLRESIGIIAKCIETVEMDFGNEVSWVQLEDINKSGRRFRYNELSKSNFSKIIVDAYYVQKFTVDMIDEEAKNDTIIAFYRTDIRISELLASLEIDILGDRFINETTVRLLRDEYNLIKNKVPYLVAMKTYDLNDVPSIEIENSGSYAAYIPKPNNEPIVGVIDTPFSNDVYFSEWVEYTSMIDEGITIDSEDYDHGTGIASLIVDGHSINPDLDDGCGRFRVRHFGVATKGRFSSFTVLRLIRRIVSQNTDIKVWNLSLGSILEINTNFISLEAAELDRIQNEYDIVFVVAGTNKPSNENRVMRIGAPADSINSIVVNSVNFDDEACSYHRVGPVLSFFNKPDVSYYGGDYNRRIRVCTHNGESFMSGTSLATPWIARKLAYLVHKVGLSREVAKALLIDSAAGWSRRDNSEHKIGFGVVPIRIEDILTTSDDEIRFIINGSADAYETYTYNLPIPINKNTQPFIARATLCYFPVCSREQGVDYTSTEMDIHFGRVKVEKGKARIQSINSNTQGDEGLHIIYEENARKLYRKWDNIKLISEVLKKGVRPRKVYGNGLWGLSIKTKERSGVKHGKGLNFGVVVTLKEINGINRINDFIKLCITNNWLVNIIDIESRLEVYAKLEETVKLE